MKKHSLGKEMHQFLENKRRANRISYKAMAECIGYSDTGLKRALEGERLSMVHINTIVDQFDFRQEFDNIFDKNNIQKSAKFSDFSNQDFLIEFILRFNDIKNDIKFKNILQNEYEIYHHKKLMEHMMSDKGFIESVKDYINN